MNGDIVEVEGGHIVRSTGTKDRHSKVCTAKGPRDRRVRLSAPTAIQFYDVQDRLGFDRPSKAVDWLINKAKSSIDDLDKLPPWNPIDTLHQNGSNLKRKKPKTLMSPTEEESSFVPVSTRLCRNYHESQDLRLSLQSFANQIEEPVMFSNESGFDQRLMTWNNSGGDGGGEGGGGFVFASSTTGTTASFQQVYGQSQVFSQRGSLQSIHTPMTRAWFDDHHQHHDSYHVASAIPAFVASNGEFSGFRLPARFQGEHEVHHRDNNKPSSDSRH